MCINKIYGRIREDPIVIFSPKNIATRRFFENTFYPPVDEMLQEIKSDYPDESFQTHVQRSMSFKEGVFEGFQIGGESNFTRLFFLAGQSFAGNPTPDSPKDIFFGFESRMARRELKEKGQAAPLYLTTNWMDIADCVVDLRVRKVWTRKYTEEEQEQAAAEQGKYKKWIEDDLLHGSLDDLIQGAAK